MEYRKKYTETELKALSAWFESRKGKLPKNFELNGAINIPDVNETADDILKVLGDVNGENVVFSGQLTMFFNLKEKLEKAGY